MWEIAASVRNRHSDAFNSLIPTRDANAEPVIYRQVLISRLSIPARGGRAASVIPSQERTCNYFMPARDEKVEPVIRGQ